MKVEAIVSAVFAMATAVAGLSGWHTAVVLGCAVVAAVFALIAGWERPTRKETDDGRA